MGYATRQEVILTLANVMTSGNPAPGPTGLVPVTSIGNSITDTVPDEVLYQMIRYADQNIDASISSVYRVPLERVNEGTYVLGLDITAGDTQAVLQDATKFIVDDLVLIRDDSSLNWQQVQVAAIPNETTLQFTAPVTDSYLIDNTTVERIRYPDPIPKVSARLAAAAIYDKYFAAQVEGNQSDYGKQLRVLAYQDLNQVLSGAIRLQIQDANMFMGRRYYNHALGDVFDTRAEAGRTWFNPGT